MNYQIKLKNLLRFFFYPHIQSAESEVVDSNIANIFLFSIMIFIVVTILCLALDISYSNNILVLFSTNIFFYVLLCLLPIFILIFLIGRFYYLSLAQNLFMTMMYIFFFCLIFYSYVYPNDPNTITLVTIIFGIEIYIIILASLFYSFKSVLFLDIINVSVLSFFYIFHAPLPQIVNTVFVLSQFLVMIILQPYLTIQGNLCRIYYYNLQNEKVVSKLTQEKFYNLFQYSPVALITLDITQIESHFTSLHTKRVDISYFLENNVHEVRNCISLIKVLDANPITTKLLDVPTSAVLSTLSKVNIYTETLFSQLIHDYAHGIAQAEHEITIQTPKSSEKNLIIRYTIFKDYQVGDTYTYVSLEDITERKRHATELFQMNSQLEEKDHFITNIITNIPIVTFKTNPQFLLTYVDGSGFNIFEHPKDLYINKPLSELFAYTDQEITGLQQQNFVKFETEGTTLSNRKYFFQVYLITHHQTKEIYGIAINITDEKLIQERLIESEKLAILGSMVAGIAHEINNPLAYIESNTEQFQEFANNARSYITDLITYMQPYIPNFEALIAEWNNKYDWRFISEDIDATISDNMNGLKLIEKVVLDLKAYGTDKNDFSFWRKIDLNELIVQTVQIMSYRDKDRIKYFHDLQPDVYIRGDYSKIYQVFLNLIKNASQAIIGKNGEISITSIKTFDNKVEIRIKDNGMGISPEIMKNLFKPFTTTKRNGVGVGLGLTIVKSIIEEHHGKIIIDSMYQKYTEVIVWLPLV